MGDYHATLTLDAGHRVFSDFPSDVKATDVTLTNSQFRYTRLDTKPPAYIPQKAANKTSRGTFCLTHYIALRQRVQGATPLAAGAKKFRLCKSRNLSVARMGLKVVAISMQVLSENRRKFLGGVFARLPYLSSVCTFPSSLESVLVSVWF